MISKINELSIQTRQPVFKAKPPKNIKELQISLMQSNVIENKLKITNWELPSISAKDLVNNIIPILKDMQRFPKDYEYRKSILNSMGLSEGKIYKLRSIIGAEELGKNLETLSKDKENFLPGKKYYSPEDGEAYFPDRENVNTGKFAANLHVHTLYSDGKFTIRELLNQGAEYGDKRVELLGKDNPFFLAITDHDSIAGCKEAINIILENPEKYKNLRLVFGIEHTTNTDYPNVTNGPVRSHLLSYGINPFDKELNKFLDDRIQINKENINRSLDYANETFGSHFSFEEFAEMLPAIRTGVVPVTKEIKKYLQFKLIYANCVEKNSVPDFDFRTPIAKMERKPKLQEGQKYYDYYFETLKAEANSKGIKVKEISEDTRTSLDEIEASETDTASKLHVPRVTLPDFSKVVDFMSNQEYGVMSVAHPGVVFPFSNLKSDDDTKQLYEMLYGDFKKFGKDRAVYAEDNYAVYHEDNTVTKELAKISEKYGLGKTGGLDTHSTNIFTSK